MRHPLPREGMGGVMKMRMHEHFDEIKKRLSKIEGHVRGIIKMLDEGKPCDEILIQFAAVRSALTKASKVLLEDHFEHCVMGKVANKELETELIEFKKALDNYQN
jgi:DNA-binding FrmR family transcriptional regulator